MQELIMSRSTHPFSAVIVSTFILSCSAIHAIKDYNLSYPEDFSFIGFDMEDTNRLFSPSITSVLQPGQQIGRILARQVMKAHDAVPGADDYNVTFVNPLIKIGESTAPV